MNAIEKLIDSAKAVIERDAAAMAADLRRLQSENESLRAGYDAARLEIASLQAQLESADDRLRDMLFADDGQAYKEAQKYLERRAQPAARMEIESLKTQPSPTAGMSIAQRILRVGGRNNAAGYVEFGSTQAVEALVRQVLRDQEVRASRCTR